METNETVKFRKWYDKRTRTGTYLRTLADGRLVVRTMHRAARGGDWANTDVVVNPSEVVA
jgi:hypothetical protein